LGGPYVSNNNRYGLKGVLDANSFFPQKAIDVGDQDGDGINDFAVNSSAWREDRLGYVIIMRGSNIPVSVEEEESNELKGFELHQNYPNPFNPTTTIKYDVARPGMVELIIFDMLGRKVKSLVSEQQNAGSYNVVFDASQLASGVYFYKLSANDYVETKKMVFLK
jgi:hypothetical protein